jgi:hypothetical protein
MWPFSRLEPFWVSRVEFRVGGFGAGERFARLGVQRDRAGRRRGTDRESLADGGDISLSLSKTHCRETIERHVAIGEHTLDSRLEPFWVSRVEFRVGGFGAGERFARLGNRR